LNGALERAARARIPVTVFDSGVESTNYMTFLATNNPGAGEMAARKLAELVRARGKVAMLMHVPGSVSTMDREIRFEEVIQQQHPGMRIVARQYGMSDRSRAASAAENILGVHPDLAGFFASSEASPVGAALALKARGLSGRVKLVGFDSTEGMLEDMRAGAIDALAGETRDPGIALPGSEKTSEPPLNDD
jgi:ribose transport system substrate-binding protein